jgi:hypothetical protein
MDLCILFDLLIPHLLAANMLISLLCLIEISTGMSKKQVMFV